MTLSGEVIGLFVTVIGSAFGITAYVSRKFAELSTDLKHVFKRIDALEEDVDAFREKPTPVATRRKRGR